MHRPSRQAPAACTGTLKPPMPPAGRFTTRWRSTSGSSCTARSYEMASNRRITEPPPILDGARVLEYAPFDAAVASSRGSAVVGGVAVDLQNVVGLVIVEDLST